VVAHQPGPHLAKGDERRGAHQKRRDRRHDAWVESSRGSRVPPMAAEADRK
jgi:hypothetical protein